MASCLLVYCLNLASCFLQARMSIRIQNLATFWFLGDLNTFSLFVNRLAGWKISASKHFCLQIKSPPILQYLSKYDVLSMFAFDVFLTITWLVSHRIWTDGAISDSFRKKNYKSYLSGRRNFPKMWWRCILRLKTKWTKLFCMRCVIVQLIRLGYVKITVLYFSLK